MPVVMGTDIHSIDTPASEMSRKSQNLSARKAALMNECLLFSEGLWGASCPLRVLCVPGWRIPGIPPAHALCKV